MNEEFQNQFQEVSVLDSLDLDMTSNGFANDTKEENPKDLSSLIKRESTGSINNESNIEQIFKYCLEDGEEQYRIIKQKRGQRFVVQRRTSGRIEYNLGDTPRIPYNLPYLKQNQGKVIWVVNGEDKVDLFKSIGLVATTAPFSSPNKWEKDFNTYLTKASGVIVLDENKKGTETYVSNTFNTIKDDDLNVGIVMLKDLARLLNIELEENSTIIQLSKKLDNTKLYELLVKVEQQILI